MLRFGGWGAPIAVLFMIFVPPVLLLWPILRNRQLRALLVVAAVVFMVGWMIAAPMVFKDVIDKARQDHALPVPTGRI